MPDDQTPNGVTTAGNPAGGTQESNPASQLTVEQQLAAAKATNERLLQESKANKERAKKVEDELNLMRQKTLQDQGQFKDLYEAEKKKNDELLKSVVQNAVRNSVSELGGKVGLQSVDAAMKLGNAQLLQFDTSSSRVEGTETFIEDLKKTHPYLFKATTTPAINPAMPGGTPPLPNGQTTASQFLKLSMEEQKKKLGELMSQLRT